MKSKFKALNFKEEGIGKIIKNSKKKYTWQFEINQKMCYLVFTYSKFSGNYLIELNKKRLYKGNKTTDNNFNFPFILENIKFSITDKASSYDLLVKGKSFQKFYDSSSERKSIFLQHEIKINNKNFQQSPNEKFRQTSLAKPKVQIRERAKTANQVPSNFQLQKTSVQQIGKLQPKNNSIFKKKKKLTKNIVQKEVLQQSVHWSSEENEEESNVFAKDLKKPHEFQQSKEPKQRKRTSKEFEYFETSEIKIWKNFDTNAHLDMVGVQLIHPQEQLILAKILT